MRRHTEAGSKSRSPNENMRVRILQSALVKIFSLHCPKTVPLGLRCKLSDELKYDLIDLLSDFRGHQGFPNMPAACCKMQIGI